MTMTLQEVLDYADSKMRQNGLGGWTFRFVNDRSRAGYCTYHSRLIAISRHHIANSSAEQVKDTVLHEIAHALVPHGKPHGAEWKQKFIELGGSGLTRVKAPDVTFTPRKGMPVVIDYPVSKYHGLTGVIEKVYRVNMDVKLNNGRVLNGKIGLWKPFNTMASVL